MAAVENAAVEQGGESDRETFEEGEDLLLDENEQEDSDVFEDAPTGVVQQTGQQQREQERGSADGPDQAAGGLQIRVRAPVTDETEENDAVEDDGEASFGSGESFDSALERMASSSAASFDTASPKISSPVGSLSGTAVLGDPPVDMSVAQQGALMRLNQMINGEPSLDTSVIENSSEEKFRAMIAELAESRNQSVEDASFGSIIDALLPVVLDKSSAEGKQSDSKSEATVNQVDITPEGSTIESKEVRSPMPKAKLTADDEPYLTDEDDMDSDEQVAEIDADENGDKEPDEKAADEVGEGKKDDHDADVVVEDTPKAEEALKADIPRVEVQEPVQDEIPTSTAGELVPESKVENQDQGLKEDEAEQPGVSDSVVKSERQDTTVRQTDGDVAEDVGSKTEPLATEESSRIFAMPTAKLTTEDSDEAIRSEGDSEERENGDEHDEQEEEEAVEEPIRDDEDDESDVEYRSEEAGEDEDGEELPQKIRAFPDTEAETAYSSAVPEPGPKVGGTELEKGLHSENGDREEAGDVEIERVFPKVRAELTPELEETSDTEDTGSGKEESEELPEQEARSLEPEVEKDIESDVSELPSTGPEPGVSEVKSTIVDEPAPSADAGEEAEQAKILEETLESVEENPSSSPLSERLEDVSDIATVKSLATPIAQTPEGNEELLRAEQGNGGVSKEGDETFEGELGEHKPVILEAWEDNSEEPSQPTAESNTSPSKFKTDAHEEALSFDPDDREDGDNAGDWDEEIEEDDDEDADALLESSSALAALVRAADAPGGGEADTPSLGAAGPSLPARPTRVGRSAPSLDSASRAVQPRSSGSAASAQLSTSDENQANGEANDGNEETREKLQVIRVKFLRLALRLGQSAHNVVVAQVLYRLGLAEQLRGGRNSSRNGAFSFDRASAIAEEQEAAGPEELDFTCTIMLLGKTGVGKSATINSIFDEPKTGTNAFMPSTKKVQEIVGHVHGIKVRVIDTPGLLPSVADQRHNEKIMASVKKFIKKSPPDIVLYFDRLDMQSRDYGDLPLLRTITDTFGAAVWFNAIVVLTHASSAPPDGPNGLPLSYEMFVAQRSHVVQQTIRQAAGDMRLMNPVSLVENHPACRMNRARQRVLPNGQVWKPQLLLLCFASKILAEANSLLKLQDNTPGRPFGARPRVPPLPFLLSSLLQSRAQLKLPDEQMGDDDESDEELDEESESDEEEDYDQLPPFRRLAREEVAELDEDNRRKYFEELSERERLFQKKQWKEELKRRREMKSRMAEAPKGDQTQLVDEGADDDMGRSAAVPVPMPDMALPPSFDSDNPSHRYRYLETANQWLVRPVLETHGWDHDSGYDGFSLEKMFVVGDKIPASVSGQITKDKKEANLTMECAASLKHGEGKVTLAGLDLQTIGKDLAYTLRSETRFSNFKGNKTTGGLAVTLLGDTIAAGMKIEDRLIVGKRLKLVLNGGAITGRGDVAYGGSLEATLRDKDYPLSRTLSTLGLSIMDWHGDLAIGANLQSQMVLGKTMVVGRANLNNRGAGQISIRASSSEQLQMALIGLLPIIRSLANRLFFSQSQQ